MDKAWDWLKKHDPDFNQRKYIEYPYLSRSQLRRRQTKHEIPVSSFKSPLVRENVGISKNEAKQLLKIIG